MSPQAELADAFQRGPSSTAAGLGLTSSDRWGTQVTFEARQVSDADLHVAGMLVFSERSASLLGRAPD